MAKPLRLALVGFGRMGATHAAVIDDADGVELAAVVDTGRKARHAAHRAHPGTEVVESVAELSGVDGWVIASSTPSHPALVRAGLQAGAHVLCEKPLALDPGEGVALGVAAQAAGCTLQVGFWRRFSPPWVAMRTALASGAIGKPLSLRLAQWDQDPPPAEFCDPAVSGGLAIDCGVHEFDLAEWLTGERVERVMGRHLPVVDDAIGAAGDVDNLVAMLELTGGVIATVELTRNARFGEDVRTEVLCSDGAVLVEMFPSGRTRLGDKRGLRIIPGSEVDAADIAGLEMQLEAFAAAIGETAAVPGASASNRAVQIAHAVNSSAASGRWVVVDETP